MVERHGGVWQTLDRDQVPTPTGDDPDVIVSRLASVGAETLARCPGATTVGRN